jgi:hypothetical protein
MKGCLRVEASFLLVFPGSRNIRHSRNISLIVCGGCCGCGGFFRGRGKMAFPGLFKVVPVGTVCVLIGDCVEA